MGVKGDYSMAEVREHNAQEDCWLVIDGQIYDVSKWAAKHHPGGAIIFKFAGKDATDAFWANHMPSVVRFRLFPAPCRQHAADRRACAPRSPRAPSASLQVEKRLKAFHVGKVTDYKVRLVPAALPSSRRRRRSLLAHARPVSAGSRNDGRVPRNGQVLL